jgi:hypothetical protein
MRSHCCMCVSLILLLGNGPLLNYYKIPLFVSVSPLINSFSISPCQVNGKQAIGFSHTSMLSLKITVPNYYWATFTCVSMFSSITNTNYCILDSSDWTLIIRTKKSNTYYLYCVTVPMSLDSGSFHRRKGAGTHACMHPTAHSSGHFIQILCHWIYSIVI